MAFTTEFIQVQPVGIKGEDSTGLFAEDCPPCKLPTYRKYWYELGLEVEIRDRVLDYEAFRFFFS